MVPSVLWEGSEVANNDVVGVKTFRDLGLVDGATIQLYFQGGPIPYQVRQSIQVNLSANSGLLFRGEIVGVSPGRPDREARTLELRCRNKLRASSSTANSDETFIDQVYRFEYQTRDERYAEVTIQGSRERVNVQYDLSWTKDIPLKSVGRKDRFVAKITGVDREYSWAWGGPYTTLRLFTGDLASFRRDDKVTLQRPWQ
jgi:hypothetical protein